MERLYSKFDKIKMSGVVISGLALLIMMFAIVADVISRNLTNASILGVYEITENYLMILVVFPALPFVYASGIMPKMELFFDKFVGRSRQILVTFILLIEVFVYLLMFYYSLQYALTGFVEKAGFMAGGNIYILYPVLFLIPLAFILMLVETLFILTRNIRMKQSNLIFVQQEETYF